MSLNLEPLRVTAYLQGPVAVPHPFILDGPLLAAIVEETADARGLDSDDLPWLDPRDVLPLLVARQGHQWYSHCSDAQHETAARGVTHWSKRLDMEEANDFLDRDRSVNLKSGRYRAHRQPLYTVVTPRIDWHLVGDRKAIERLLPRVRGLGKKRGYGLGAVVRWEVEPETEDRSLQREDGSLARPLPVANRRVGKWIDRGQLVVTKREWLQPNPPYWTQHHPAACAIEGRWADAS